MGSSGSILAFKSSLVGMKSRISDNEKVKYLQNTPFSTLMSDQLLTEFATCFVTHIRIAKERQLELGADDLNVVAEGELELSAVVPSTTSKHESAGYLCRKRPGDIVTKLSTKEDAQRKASLSKKVSSMMIEDVKIIACAPTLLLIASQKSINAFLDRNPLLKGSVAKITTTMISDKLAKIPFLKQVKTSQLSVLSTMCRYEVCDAEEIVFEEGSLGSKLYIVLNGNVSVYTESNDSANNKRRKSKYLRKSLELQSDQYKEGSTCVANLGPGDYFGETSLLVHVPRTLTVKAGEKSLFLTVDKVDFENFLKVCSIKDYIDNMMKNRMVQMLSSIGIPFFVGITTEKLTKITEHMKIHEVDEGNIIFHEGDIGDRFYIIFYGEVSIDSCSINKEVDPQLTTSETKSSNESIKIGTFTSGHYFGETALISDSPRSATVRALCKTVLLSIEKKSFREVFLTDEKVLAEFQLRVLKERSELCHILSHTKSLNTFRQFLKHDYADENLEFWEECNSFKLREFADEEDFDDEAQKIYSKFFDKNSEKEINIPALLRAKAKEKLDKKERNLDMFEEAKTEIYKVMKQDNYERFKKSEEFIQLFKKLGIVLHPS